MTFTESVFTVGLSPSTDFLMCLCPEDLTCFYICMWKSSHSKQRVALEEGTSHILFFGVA